MALNDENKIFAGGGLDQDSAPEFVAPNDFPYLLNGRVTGTGIGQSGKINNISSNQLIAAPDQPGLSSCNGGGAFEDIRAAVLFRPNSTGKNEILYYDYDTNSIEVIYTDLTDSAGESLLPLDPQQWIACILVNKTYLIWTAKNLEVGYTNLNTLRNGAYGTVLWEDLSLIKPQCMPPPTGSYGSDDGQPANFWFGILPQAIVQYVNDDFNYSAWSTRSKRQTPYQQNTPTTGSDVSQNNYIIWSFDIGSIRATTLNFAIQLDDSGQFYQVKSTTRSHVTGLPNTAVDVSTEILEAYDPVTNLYSFVDYNNTVKIPVDPTETNLFYDYIWFGANACEVLNGNIAALADWTIPYSRITVPVTIAAVGYNANIGIPAPDLTDPLRAVSSFPGSSGSGAGDHRRVISITLGGTPHTGDQILVTVADIRDANNTANHGPYVVPSALDGNLAGVVAAYTPYFPNSSYTANGDGTYTITWIDDPYFGLQNFSVDLFFAGAPVVNSIPSIPDDSTLQLALSVRDKQARPFPLITDDSYIIHTPSYAQVNGNAIQLTATIGAVTLPPQAFDAQWVITAPVQPKIVDTTAVLLNYIGTWDASTNTPTLAINGSNNVGDTYQVSTPASPTVPATYHNIGNNATYNTGDYVVYNGHSWDVIERSFGDLTASGNIMAFSLNPLKLYNDSYSEQGVTTIVAYDFAPGDRCTLHYYLSGGFPVYFNQPCINLSVLGYDAGNYIVKVERSAALDYTSGVKYNGNSIAATNIFMRLYSPGLQAQSVSAVSNSTVWWEIGERFTITNETFDQTVFNLHDGGVYYKTRQFPDALMPYANPPIETLATDLNYSDFYASAFWSKGRARTFYDVLENTEQRAEIIPSQNYIIGSRLNGLNRFFPAGIYGDGDGQCSSSHGAIQVLWMRGDVLVVMQEDEVFYIPVNYAWTIVNEQITGTSISEKLLNNGRYSSTNIGIGTAKESFWKRYSQGGFIDPNNSLPMQMHLDGIDPIPGKMSKYFKSQIQAAYTQGKKILQYYDTYYEEVKFATQSLSSILNQFLFTPLNWDVSDHFTVAPGDITASDGSHSTVSYNSGTGVATYTPAPNYVGGDVAEFSFPVGSKNVCLSWTAGSGNVNPFAFLEQFGVPLSTEILSNTIGVSGNDFPVVISITGGSYSINGGSFVSTPGTVPAGASVQVEVLSSAANGTMSSCTLTIDSQSATFTVVTQAAGNFIASANYGMKIDSIVNGTGSGVPAGFNPCNLLPGQTLAAAYTSFAIGTYTVTLDGLPVIPGHVYMGLSVNGILQDSFRFDNPTIRDLTNSLAATDPTQVMFFAFTMS